MARKIANNQGLYVDAAVVSAFPFTFSCWFYVDDVTTRHPLMWIGQNGSDTNWCGMEVAGTVANDPVYGKVGTYGTGTARTAKKIGATAGVWLHAAIVFASTTSRYAYLSGSASSHSTDASAAMTGDDRFSIGYFSRASKVYGDYTYIAEAAAYSAALSSTNIALLAAGRLPLLTDRANLAEYWPLGGRYGNTDAGIYAGNDLTAVGSPTWVAHPANVVYPRKPVTAMAVEQRPWGQAY